MTIAAGQNPSGDWNVGGCSINFILFLNDYECYDNLLHKNT